MKPGPHSLLRRLPAEGPWALPGFCSPGLLKVKLPTYWRMHQCASTTDISHDTVPCHVPKCPSGRTPRWGYPPTA